MDDEGVALLLHYLVNKLNIYTFNYINVTLYLHLKSVNYVSEIENGSNMNVEECQNV